MAMTCPKDRKVTYATYTLVDEAEFHNIELNRLWKIMENPSLGEIYYLIICVCVSNHRLSCICMYSKIIPMIIYN